MKLNTGQLVADANVQAATLDLSSNASFPKGQPAGPANIVVAEECFNDGTCTAI